MSWSPTGTVPIVFVVGFLMIGLAGAVVGANEAAADREPVDLFEMLHEETFTDDGEIKDREPPETQPAELREMNERLTEHAERLSSLFPDTPQLDRLIRQSLVAPMLIIGFHIADGGFTLGYDMASTLGARLTRLFLKGVLVSVLVGVALHRYRQFREVAR